MNIVMILVNIINKNSTPEAPYLIIGSTDASESNILICPPIHFGLTFGSVKNLKEVIMWGPNDKIWNWTKSVHLNSLMLDQKCSSTRDDDFSLNLVSSHEYLFQMLNWTTKYTPTY